MNARPVVHQFTAIYSERDAVGHHTYVVDSILKEIGCETTVFAEQPTRNTNIDIVDFRKHSKYPKPDAIIYQMSTGSTVAGYLANRTEPLILNYHNITPSHFFTPWAPHIGYVLMQAREELAILAKQAVGGIADSRYNAQELVELGMSNVAVVPVLLNLVEVDPVSRANRKNSPFLLYVGRIVPNKRIEHIIGALVLLRERWQEAHLTIIGSPVIPEYYAALKELAERLDVNDSVDFTQSVDQAVRDRHYSASSVYVSASAHEGFCVPLVEAMSAGLPVVAYGATAVAETLGDGGMLLEDNSPMSLATGICQLLEHDDLHCKYMQSGRQRASRFSPIEVRRTMAKSLEALLRDL